LGQVHLHRLRRRDPEQAHIFITNWLAEAWASGIDLLVRFANKLVRHLEGILNYFEHRITTGKVEGINNPLC